MVRSYLVDLGWAAIIALSVWPVYSRIAPRFGNSRIAAPLLAALFLAILLVIPITIALIELGREAQFVMLWISDAQQNGMPVPEWVQRLPVLGQQLDAWWRTHLSRPQSAGEFLSGIDTQAVAEWSKTLGGELISRLLHTLLTFMVLFVMLRDGGRIAPRALMLIDQWFGRPGERLAEKTVLAVRGTVNGTVLVAIGEGVLIGIGFVLAGVPHGVLLAILTIAFAMLPMGAWFAFGAAAILLIISGGTFVAAASVFGWGAIIMLIGDNFIQPALIGGTVRLPFLWTLIGIIGGLQTFGLIGLFLGPVILAALVSIWREQIDTTFDPHARTRS
jgi:predicted PurR-regulated permease PerM